MTTNNKITTNTQEMMMMMSYGHNSNPEMTLSTTRNPSPPRLSQRQQELQRQQQRQTVVRLPSVVKLFLAGQQGTVSFCVCVCEKKKIASICFCFCFLFALFNRIIITTQIHFYYYYYSYYFFNIDKSKCRRIRVDRLRCNNNGNNNNNNKNASSYGYDGPASFDKLVQLAAETFQFPHVSRVSLSYQISETETSLLLSDDDLADALLFLGGAAVDITVSKKQYQPPYIHLSLPPPSGRTPSDNNGRTNQTNDHGNNHKHNHDNIKNNNNSHTVVDHNHTMMDQSLESTAQLSQSTSTLGSIPSSVIGPSVSKSTPSIMTTTTTTSSSSPPPIPPIPNTFRLINVERVLSNSDWQPSMQKLQIVAREACYHHHQRTTTGSCTDGHNNYSVPQQKQQQPTHNDDKSHHDQDHDDATTSFQLMDGENENENELLKFVYWRDDGSIFFIANDRDLRDVFASVATTTTTTTTTTSLVSEHHTNNNNSSCNEIRIQTLENEQQLQQLLQQQQEQQQQALTQQKQQQQEQQWKPKNSTLVSHLRGSSSAMSLGDSNSPSSLDPIFRSGHVEETEDEDDDDDDEDDNDTEDCGRDDDDTTEDYLSHHHYHLSKRGSGGGGCTGSSNRHHNNNNKKGNRTTGTANRLQQIHQQLSNHNDKLNFLHDMMQKHQENHIDMESLYHAAATTTTTMANQQQQGSSDDDDDGNNMNNNNGDQSSSHDELTMKDSARIAAIEYYEERMEIFENEIESQKLTISSLEKQVQRMETTYTEQIDQLRSMIVGLAKNNSNIAAATAKQEAEHLVHQEKIKQELRELQEHVQEKEQQEQEREQQREEKEQEQDRKERERQEQYEQSQQQLAKLNETVARQKAHNSELVINFINRMKQMENSMWTMKEQHEQQQKQQQEHLQRQEQQEQNRLVAVATTDGSQQGHDVDEERKSQQVMTTVSSTDSTCIQQFNPNSNDNKSQVDSTSKQQTVPVPTTGTSGAIARSMSQHSTLLKKNILTLTPEMVTVLQGVGCCVRSTTSKANASSMGAASYSSSSVSAQSFIEIRSSNNIIVWDLKQELEPGRYRVTISLCRGDPGGASCHAGILLNVLVANNNDKNSRSTNNDNMDDTTSCSSDDDNDSNTNNSSTNSGNGFKLKYKATELQEMLNTLNFCPTQDWHTYTKVTIPPKSSSSSSSPSYNTGSHNMNQNEILNEFINIRCQPGEQFVVVSGGWYCNLRGITLEYAGELVDDIESVSKNGMRQQDTSLQKQPKEIHFVPDDELLITNGMVTTDKDDSAAPNSWTSSTSLSKVNDKDANKDESRIMAESSPSSLVTNTFITSDKTMAKTTTNDSSSTDVDNMSSSSRRNSLPVRTRVLDNRGVKSQSDCIGAVGSIVNGSQQQQRPLSRSPMRRQLSNAALNYNNNLNKINNKANRQSLLSSLTDGDVPTSSTRGGRRAMVQRPDGLFARSFSSSSMVNNHQQVGVGGGGGASSSFVSPLRNRPLPATVSPNDQEVIPSRKDDNNTDNARWTQQSQSQLLSTPKSPTRNRRITPSSSSVAQSGSRQLPSSSSPLRTRQLGAMDGTNTTNATRSDREREDVIHSHKNGNNQPPPLSDAMTGSDTNKSFGGGRRSSGSPMKGRPTTDHQAPWTAVPTSPELRKRVEGSALGELLNVENGMTTRPLSMERTASSPPRRVTTVANPSISQRRMKVTYTDQSAESDTTTSFSLNRNATTTTTTTTTTTPIQQTKQRPVSPTGRRTSSSTTEPATRRSSRQSNRSPTKIRPLVVGDHSPTRQSHQQQTRYGSPMRVGGNNRVTRDTTTPHQSSNNNYNNNNSQNSRNSATSSSKTLSLVRGS